MKVYLMCVGSLLIGILFGYISAGKIYFEKFLSSINDASLFVSSRLDKMLIGNDGVYSHTRVINLCWGIGGFWLICIVVMRSIEIPGEILVLMGGAMGISGLQSVVNKANELKFASGESISPRKPPVADGVKDDKSN